MPVNTDSINTILRAFQAGRQMKLQREGLQQRALEHTQRLEEQEKERAQRLKIFEEQSRYQRERDEAQRKIQDAIQIMAKDRLRSEVISKGMKGELGSSLTLNAPAVPEGLPTQFAVPAAKGVLKTGLESMPELSPEQWQTPAEIYDRDPKLLQQRKLAEDLRKHQVGLESMREGFQTGQLEKNIESREKIAGMQIAAANSRAKLAQSAAWARMSAASARNDETGKRLAKSAANGLIGQFIDNDAAKIMRKILPDYERMIKYSKNPSAMTGINDVDLIYMAARNFDPSSTVRESEVSLIGKNNGNWLEQLELNVGNALNIARGKSQLSPAARARIIKALVPRIKDNAAIYQGERDSFAARVDDSLPGYSTHIPDYIGDVLRANGLAPPKKKEEAGIPRYENVTPEQLKALMEAGRTN